MYSSLQHVKSLRMFLSEKEEIICLCFRVSYLVLSQLQCALAKVTQMMQKWLQPNLSFFREEAAPFSQLITLRTISLFWRTAIWKCNFSNIQDILFLALRLVKGALLLSWHWHWVKQTCRQENKAANLLRNKKQSKMKLIFWFDCN